MKNVFLIKSFGKEQKKENHIIFICDHATNLIPKELNSLGLESKFLKSHIAFDIGAMNLSINLASKLKQTCFLSNFSRLVIDPNRDLTDSSLIPPSSFGINIPGNININSKEKSFRINNFYKPYHSELFSLVKQKMHKFKKIFLISIHSFTQKFIGFDRGYEVGLLWNKNMNLLIPIQRNLTRRKIHFGRNYPYSGFHFNFTIDHINKFFNLDNISIEVRNDLLCSQKGIKNYVDIFSNIFKGLLNDR